jgi:hypothetical protein
MSRATRKIQRLSSEVSEQLVNSAYRDPNTTDRNKAAATWIVKAADYALDALVATNESAARAASKARVKDENKRLAIAFEDFAAVKRSWVLLAHELVIFRRDNTTSAEARASEHLYLRLLNAEYPLDEDSRQWLEVSRHPEPWVRAADSQAMATAYGVLATILGAKEARSLALFDESATDAGWAIGFVLCGHWLGAASAVHLDHFDVGEGSVDQDDLFSEA